MRHGQVEYSHHALHREVPCGRARLCARSARARAGYSLAIAHGVPRDAVEWCPKLGIFGENTAPGVGRDRHPGGRPGTAFFARRGVRVTLLLGPMYHLFTRKTNCAPSPRRARAMPGGILMAAYCAADASVLQTGSSREHF
jgi:hypothetical protein